MLRVGEPATTSTGLVSSMCSALAGATANSGVASNALAKLVGSTMITVPAAMLEDCNTGMVNFGPASSLSISACVGLVTSTGAAPAPAVTSAPVSALRSAVSAFMPPPAVGGIGVTPLRMPPGVVSSSGSVPNNLSSNFNAVASEIKARDTASMFEDCTISAV